MKNDYLSQFPYAELRSQDGMTSFKICTYEYAYPQADDSQDADWHRNYLIITMPAFKVEFDEVIFEGNIIKYFIQELHSFSALQKKEVFFEPTEPYFELTFIFISREKVRVDGVVQYPVGWGAELKFEFETDLTYIDEFIKGLETILINFPSKI